MIRGLVVPGLGAFVLATVHLPPPLDRRTEVLFVVDTGSERTVLMPRDVAAFDLNSALRDTSGVALCASLTGNSRGRSNLLQACFFNVQPRLGSHINLQPQPRHDRRPGLP